ncbi:MAG: glycerol-3-phosphate dehydrogenase [Christensenella sp.]|uniref:glycerol-3-phosphate dehydrogenase n=1 Tax=Christensenella sp. TaxID=1935934 RepID=UPI002B1FC489|nr:glycerol-3-phosphate dehydrogenase [Christensenella sp.]MEA5003613.1 glycerol-3-phosphate dehydrogenase [Christensenella sp.]
MSIITVVGAGMMGTAISFPASDNGNEIRLVGTPLDRHIIEHARKTDEHLTLKRKIPDGFSYFQIEQLDEALKDADLLVSGVSSFGVDWFLEEILSVIPETLPVLMVTKGMQDTEDGGLIPYPLLYAQKLDRKLSLYAVGGPCTSYELTDHDPTQVCFCGGDMETLRKIKSMFETDYYHVSLSTDIVGVECAVAMKNAYALAVTLAVGLSQRTEGVDGKQHYNSQAALFGQSIREMRKLLALVGGGDDNLVYGAGDLYVTIFGGRTRYIGTLLGRGLSFEEAMAELEGVTLESIVIATRTARAVRVLIERGKVRSEDFPLLLHVDDIINHKKAVDIPWSSFEVETYL